MFSHLMIGTNDLAKAQVFYDAVFSAIGEAPGMIDRKGRLVYSKDGQRFLITRPINSAPATAANGGTIGFAVRTPDLIDAWHRAGVDNGGTAIEDPPGEREAAIGRVYLAYLRDPDGHKLCALHYLETD